MPWPVDHPALIDPQLLPWSTGLDLMCPDAEFVRVLRYLPGRRVTSQIRLGDQEFILKLFASPRARGNERRLGFWKHSSVGNLVPTPFGSDRSGHLELIEFVPGTPLNQLDGDEFVHACEMAGDALRKLHTSGVELDRTWTISEELDQLERRSTPRASTAISALILLDFSGGGPLISAHRDCHPGQAVVEGDQFRWIDLDDSAMAPAGLDVGNLIAHLRRYGAVDKRAPEVITRAIEAFRGAYGELPDGHDVWEWLTLARLACLEENRHRRSDQASVLLDLLTELSGGLTSVAPTASDKSLRQVQHGDEAVKAALDEVGIVPSGSAVLVPTGHEDRPVFRVESNVGTVALKFFSARARNSPFRDHLNLWNSPLGETRQTPGLPRPFGWSSSQHCLVMEWLDGEPLARRGDPPTRKYLAEAASLLADFHGCGVRYGKVRDAEAILRSSERKCAEIRGTSVGELAERIISSLADQLPDDNDFVISHGDFSPRNIIVTTDGLRLIDFDRIQLADPARDVSYYGAWSWVTGLLFDGKSDWSIAEEFTSEYLRHRESTELKDQLSFHYAAALIRIVHGWTILRRDPERSRPVLEEALRILENENLRATPS